MVTLNAGKRSGETVTLWEFAKVGAPLTVVNVAVYWLFGRML